MSQNISTFEAALEINCLATDTVNEVIYRYLQSGGTDAKELFSLVPEQFEEIFNWLEEQRQED